MVRPVSLCSPRDVVRLRHGRGLLGALALLAVLGCADGDRAAPPAGDPQCVLVRTASIRLVAEEGCVVANDPLSRRLLPDLEFSPGLCFTTGATQAEIVAPDGRTLLVDAAVYSGIDTNRVTGTGLAPFPVPLTDSAGQAHVYISVTAASLIDVRSRADGARIGALVTRDAGWAELDGETGLPSFVTERLAVTGSSAGLFADVVGEFIATGDEFGDGSPAIGSLCGAGLIDGLFATAR